MKRKTLDEMREAIARAYLEDSFEDGGKEDIVWNGFKGVNDMTSAEVRAAYDQIYPDGDDDEED